jgi:DNA-binding transcriptional ArsR family regulator
MPARWVLRLQILALLVEEPRTVKQIAAQLDMAATKLYYHVNLLELHGLIRVTSSRVVSGIIERQYQVTAERFRVARSLLSVSSSAENTTLDTLLSGALEHTRGDIKASAQQGLIEFAAAAPRHRTLLLSRTLGRMPLERAEEFYARLEALVQEFDAVAGDPSNDDPHMYGIAVVMYPIDPPQFKEESGDG